VKNITGKENYPMSSQQKSFEYNPKKINIVIPFEGAEQKVRIWAESEKVIDFRRDFPESAKCTVSFAACELMDFLHQLIPDMEISFSSKKHPGIFSICLDPGSYTSDNPAYEIAVKDGSLNIRGKSRTGVLYGVYHFLKLQGFRWYAPGEKGEICPAATDTLRFPKNKIAETPSFNILRGFDFEKPSMESVDLLLWMARNRLNLAGPRPQTTALARKLGMKLKSGGHIFNEILATDRILLSGKSVWEEHPEWYGLSENGKREKEKALWTQFCVCAPGLLEFLGDELIKTINSEWQDADYVDIWGFDTWDSVCTCEKCSELGNGTDRNLYFVAAMRRAINRGLADGTLKNQVKLICCAYEGTVTIEAPLNPVPAELAEAGDICTFYPINRCYRHDLSDENCVDNNIYRQHLENWRKVKGNFEIMLGEYYNVSRFEDLPLLFTARMQADIPFYNKLGVRALTYMHLPLCCWGIRRFNHLLYSELLWNIKADVKELTAEYFINSYGEHSEKLNLAYKKLEKAWLYIQQWRAWNSKSVLSQLHNWDGKRPLAELSTDKHFNSVDELIKSGEKSVELMQDAFDIMSECLNAARNSAHPLTNTARAVNPLEFARQAKVDSIIFFIKEDRRMVRYGIDSMSLITELTKFYEAWRKNDIENAGIVWRKLTSLSDAMSLYYIPIKYIDHQPGIDCPDAFTRTQLRQILERCRYFIDFV
jgi:hypothetical protein